jgi:hypothetical protein
LICMAKLRRIRVRDVDVAFLEAGASAEPSRP